MVSGRKALLEYIKSTYRRRESLLCELDCFSPSSVIWREKAGGKDGGRGRGIGWPSFKTTEELDNRRGIDRECLFGALTDLCGESNL